MKLTTRIVGYDLHEIFYGNKYIGEFVKDVDGYYKFFPDADNGGYWDSYILKALVEKLDEINKEWDEQVNREIGNA